MPLTPAERAKVDQQYAAAADLLHAAVRDLRRFRGEDSGDRTAALASVTRVLWLSLPHCKVLSLLGVALDILADHPELDDPGIPGIDVTGDAGGF